MFAEICSKLVAQFSITNYNRSREIVTVQKFDSGQDAYQGSAYSHYPLLQAGANAKIVTKK